MVIIFIGGSKGSARDAPDSIVFIFMQFFCKIYQNNRFEAPPLRLAPTPGNPGSATDNKQSSYYFKKIYFGRLWIISKLNIDDLLPGP